jgi:hypothetical protein
MHGMHGAHKVFSIRLIPKPERTMAVARQFLPWTSTSSKGKGREGSWPWGWLAGGVASPVQCQRWCPATRRQWWPRASKRRRRSGARGTKVRGERERRYAAMAQELRPWQHAAARRGRWGLPAGVTAMACCLALRWGDFSEALARLDDVGGLGRNSGERNTDSLHDSELDVGRLLCSCKNAAFYEIEGGESRYQSFKYGRLGDRLLACAMANSSRRSRLRRGLRVGPQRGAIAGCPGSTRVPTQPLGRASRKGRGGNMLVFPFLFYVIICVDVYLYLYI